MATIVAASTPAWFYNSNSGAIEEATNTPELLADEVGLHAGIGWHGPYSSLAAANAAKAAEPAAAAPLAAIGAVGSDASAVARFLGKFNVSSAGLRSYALRGLKIITGLVLVIMGLAHLTHLPAAAEAAARAVPAV